MSELRRRPKRIRKENWEAVNSPPLTTTQLRRLRPAAKAMPDLVHSYRRTRGRPKTESPKTLVSLRLDADVIDAFRADGPGWQTRINAVLARWAKRHKAA